ncbi:MAG: hypothetical protein NVS9B2_25150 [Steroidobacteraceae bacterium]
MVYAVAAAFKCDSDSVPGRGRNISGHLAEMRIVRSTAARDGRKADESHIPATKLVERGVYC